MATSLAIMMLLGLLGYTFFTKLKLPGLLGIILVGFLIGPKMLGWIAADNIWLSEDVRKMALIIILLRAGLGVKKEDLKKVGKSAIAMGFLPCLLEAFLITLGAMKLLNFTWIQGAILGFILAAVSPAVIVPQMLKFIESKWGTKKGIPTLILAGASLDNVFAITLFSTFLGLYSGQQLNIGLKIIGIPVSIGLGAIAGALIGFTMAALFHRFHIRDTKKVLMILGASILLMALEKQLKTKVEIAGLVGVMTIGFILLEKLPKLGMRLSLKFNKIWIFAEILLFTLVGTQIDLEVMIDAGLMGLVLILLGLLGRGIGVLLSTIRTPLSPKERLFCAIAYMPKATVQAAIGAIPLSLGVASGDTILAISVLSIVVTAPLGAILIEFLAPKLLEIHESEQTPSN
ncbi:MAG: cation:proton antiporter [Vallitaleaceae bacterium]|nr:cation:proton antiporter [Vallitaleaceae bacterium]